MAGDWIKLEKCSPNKPEVMRLARMWGIHQDQAFGALMRFWIWVDDACVDGVVDGVASQEVDDMMRFPGFACGLSAVGWLEIDDAKPCIRIPNFAKHNTETAKKRALTSARQARWRAGNVDVPVDAHVDGAASTREEKRREEVRTKEASPLLSGKPDGAVRKRRINGRDTNPPRQAFVSDAKEVLTFLNDKAGRNFPPTDSNVGMIVARFREGFTPLQLRQVVLLKARKWRGDEEMAQYLRPETLFGRQKFSNYVGELVEEADA